MYQRMKVRVEGEFCKTKDTALLKTKQPEQYISNHQCYICFPCLFCLVECTQRCEIHYSERQIAFFPGGGGHLVLIFTGVCL